MKCPIPRNHTYEEAIEAAASNPLFQKYHLQLSQQRNRYRIHSSFYNAVWLNQYTGSPKLFMNPVNVEKRNLSKGDIVKVFNDRGSFACRYEPDDGVSPGHPRVFEGCWNKYLEKGNIQAVTGGNFKSRGYSLVYSPAYPINDVLVEVRKMKEAD